MKRLLSSNDIEPVIKRVRYSISSSENDQEIISNSSDSQNEDINNECQEMNDDKSSSSISLLNNKNMKIIEQEKQINNNHEFIDLTKDESNSSTCLSLQHEFKTSFDIEECPICLETFIDLQILGIYLLITPCEHVLCTLCIQQLLSTSSRCPLCQKPIHSTTLIPYCILT